MSLKVVNRVHGRAAKRRKLSHGDTYGDDVSGDGSDDSSLNGEEGSDSSDDSEHDRSEGVAAAGQAAGTRPIKPQMSNHTRPAIVPTNPPASLILQTSSLLKEITPDHDAIIKRARPTTDRLMEAIKEVPARPEMSLAEAQSFSQKTLRVTIPWSHRPLAGIQYKFGFVPPTHARTDGELVGQLTTKSSERKLVIRPEMPNEMFDEKDYLDHRAIHKRAFYISCIASALREKLGQEYEIKFGYANGVDLVPVLLISTEVSGKPFMYEINPCFPESLGRKDKMTPAHSCLRKDKSSQSTADPTPMYNSTVRNLASQDEFFRLVREASQAADNFQDACRLGAVWLEQRSMSSTVEQGGFGLAEWAILCALLLTSGRQGGALLLPRYNALQLFKGVLQVLSLRDAYDPYVLRGDIKLEKSGIPMIYDSITGVNILYKMPPWSYERLKHHATTSLAQLNSKRSNAFDTAFNSKVAEQSLEFEQSYAIDLSPTEKKHEDVLSRMHEVLKRGFGDRVTLLSLFRDSIPSWKITSSAPDTKPDKIRVGLLINSEAALRFVDHGPSVEDKEAAEDFRNFWGEKAELRKFQDGSITETLVWSKDTRVLEQNIRYLLQRHFGIASNNIMSSPYLQKLQLTDTLHPDEAFAIVNQKLQALISTLHHIDGLPLPVRSVNAASDLARSASLILPLASGTAQPIDIVIQFDTSGRWPDDLQAIQYTKIAFLTKIGDLLSKSDKSLDCSVGLENAAASATGTHNTSFLDIVQPLPGPQLPPIVFRLRIYHERELHLIQQALSSKNTPITQLRDVYQVALQSQKQVMARMHHTTAIRSLVTLFPALSATIRLLKRFLSVHRLLAHVSNEIVEIMACNAFLNPAPWSVPGTSTAAFSRCLYFLSSWDWSAEPLIVDLNAAQDMTSQQRQELHTRFNAWRKLDPNMNSVAWFIATNLDGTGVLWTQGISGQDPKPARVVASRLTALTGAAIRLLKTVDTRQDKLMTEDDWAAIFMSSSDDFDFVIHLKDSSITNSQARHLSNGKFKNLQVASAMDADTTGIDIVSAYLDELQQSFGSVAVFFYGGKHSDSNAICGLWRPHVRPGIARPLKIRLGMSTVPCANGSPGEHDINGACIPNLDEILAEMGMLGQGIVSSITTE